jgi:hypothetical protein
MQSLFAQNSQHGHASRAGGFPVITGPLVLLINNISAAVMGGVPKLFFHRFYEFLGFLFRFNFFKGTDKAAFGYYLLRAYILCDCEIHNLTLPPFPTQNFI